MVSQTEDWGRGEVMAVISIVFVVAAVFGRTSGFTFLNWDDDAFVLHANVIHWFDTAWQVRLTTPHIGYAIPIPTAVHAVLHRIFGEEQPWAFHLINVVVHMGNAVLVFTLFRRLGVETKAATGGVLLWAIHPVMAEPVAWVTGLKDLLSMSGVVLSLLAVHELARRRSSLLIWLLIVVGPILAMGSKPTGVVVGPMMLLVVVFWWKRLRPSMRRWGLGVAGGWTVVGLALSAWSYVVHDQMGGHDMATFSVGRVCRALEVMLRNYVFPINLSPAYIYTPGQLSSYVIGLALIGLALLIGWRTWKRRSLISLGVGWAAIALVPVSNIVPMNRFVADSYLYTPTLGIALAVTVWWTQWSARRDEKCGGDGGSSSPWKRTVAVGALIALGVMTWAQTSHWRDSITLMEYTAVRAPEAPIVHVQLGKAYFEEGRYIDAIETFETLDTAFGWFPDRPAEWPMAYCSVGALERCEELLIELIERGPRNRTPHRIRQWRHVLTSYALFCHRMSCEIDASIGDQARQLVVEAMELFERGLPMEEVDRRIATAR